MSSGSLSDRTSDGPVCGAFSFLWPRKRTPALTLVNPNHETEDDVTREEDTGASTRELCRAYSSPPWTDPMAESTESITCLGSTSSTRNTAQSGDDDPQSPHRSSSWRSFFAPDGGVALPSTQSRKRGVLEYTDEELLLSDSNATVESDLSRCHLHPVWIVTTAAVPWMTGTAINPLLRAAHLALYYCAADDTATLDTSSSSPAARVHLVLPWLTSAHDRVTLYGPDWEHVDGHYQEAYIQHWMQQHVPQYSSIGQGVQIHWYPARYHAALGSIFALGDICSRLPIPDANLEGDSAICILEEPEHLNYYRGGHWRTRFAHVVGIIHTNYCEYAKQSILAAPLVGAVSAWMVQAYCDKVIQLSATLPSYAPEKEVVCNVHGVRAEFLTNHARVDDPRSQEPRIYFLGKLLWAKGLDKLWQLQHVWKQHTQSFFPMDIYGSGADQDDIQRAFAGEGGSVFRNSTMGSSTSGGVRHCRSYSELASSYWWPSGDRNSSSSSTEPSDAMPVQFLGRIDHAIIDHDRSCRYKIFVNPSISEVLCTVTAEATAMNKFVIIPQHPSNDDFFVQFPNCLLYKNDAEFVSHLQYALTHEPVPLSPEQQTLLTWEGATERFIRASCISYREAARRDRLRVRDQRLADWHIKMGQGTTGDVLRQFLGGGPVAKQSLYEDDHSSSLTAEEDPIVPNLSRASSASVSPVVAKRSASCGTLVQQGTATSPPPLAI